MVKEVAEVAALLDSGVLLVIAGLFLLMVYKIFASWQKSLAKRDEKEELREKQQYEMVQGVSAALERSSGVIERNTDVIQSHQNVLEQVIGYTMQLSKTQEGIQAQLDDLGKLSNKIYTELRIANAKDKPDA